MKVNTCSDRAYRRGVVAAVMLALIGVGVPAAAQTADVTVEYYHVDAMGSVRAVTDQSGTVVRRHDYFPFGDGPVEVSATTDPLRFSGKERDLETGLDYFGARYYASRAGQFTSVDPALNVDLTLMNPQRWNRYSYALNNPVRYADPNGREPVTLTILGVAVAPEVAAAAAATATAATVYVWNKREDIASSIVGAGEALASGVSWVRARFVGEPNGTLVDTESTPAGRYVQPNAGGNTDILSRDDHGAGHSHTHEVEVHRNPADPSKGRTVETDRTHPVTPEEVANIRDGTATKSKAKGR